MRLSLIIPLLLGAVGAFSQAKNDSLIRETNPDKWAAAIEKKADRIEGKLLLQSQKTLKKLQVQEEKIYRKMLRGADSLQAKAFLATSKDRYTKLLDQLREKPGTTRVVNYIPGLDTLNSTLKFLDLRTGGEQLHKALSATQSLQDRFQQAGEIRNFIRERKAALKAQLEKLGLLKELKQFNRQAYYYSEQLKEWSSYFKDHRKAEKKLIELVSSTPAFQEFMRKNSLLATLFRMPGQDPNDPAIQASMAGLQTRTQVNGLIQQQINAGGPNALNQFRQNLSDAQGQINQLKEKMGRSGLSGSEDIMPEGFKPNSQRTKSFFKRLEYGTNIQTQRATSFFPVTSDIGLSVGYRVNDNSVIGIGASYKMGWGRGWNNINISNEGAGLRSFIDWKLKGSLSISGGYEQNYRTAFRDFDRLRDQRAWQQSGLIGISKIVSIKSKFFKNSKVQLLWDFLSSRQVPQTQPIIFRVGYKF